MLVVTVWVEEIWSAGGAIEIGSQDFKTQEKGAGEVSRPKADTHPIIQGRKIQISTGIMLKVPDLEVLWNPPLLEVPGSLEMTTGPGPEDTEPLITLWAQEKTKGLEVPEVPEARKALEKSELLEALVKLPDLEITGKTRPKVLEKPANTISRKQDLNLSVIGGETTAVGAEMSTLITLATEEIKFTNTAIPGREIMILIKLDILVIILQVAGPIMNCMMVNPVENGQR